MLLISDFRRLASQTDLITVSCDSFKLINFYIWTNPLTTFCFYFKGTGNWLCMVKTGRQCFEMCHSMGCHEWSFTSFMASTDSQEREHYRCRCAEGVCLYNYVRIEDRAYTWSSSTCMPNNAQFFSPILRLLRVLLPCCVQIPFINIGELVSSRQRHVGCQRDRVYVRGLSKSGCLHPSDNRQYKPKNAGVSHSKSPLSVPSSLSLSLCSN